MNPKLVARCREKLIKVAKQKGTITYGEMAAHLGMANQAVGPYLNALYDDLVIKSRLPDLTLLAVYSGTKYGKYNSRGRPAQSVEFDPNHQDHRRIYDSDRELVYQHWA
jgi:predicted ArsR family transcriptional regulator